MQAFALTPVLRAAPSERITLGVIGVGWQGTNNLKSFLEQPDVEILALCDVDQAHLERAEAEVRRTGQHKSCGRYRYFEEVLAREDIDAVVLSLPDHWHGVVSVAAARTGKDIYGEKPLAHNFREGLAICEAVQRYGRVWQTGSWQRSVPRFRQACELVRNGRLGQIRRVEIGLPSGYIDFEGTAGQTEPGNPPPGLDYDRWLGPAPWAPYCPARVHKNWRYHLDYGGGLLMDWVGHHLDIAHWALGLDETGPVEVIGKGTFLPGSPLWNAPVAFEVTARYAGELTIVMGGESPGRRRGCCFIGERGWLWVDRAGWDAEPRSLLDEKIQAWEIHLPVSAGHHRQFLDCVKSGGPTLCPPEVGLRSVTPGYLGLISILLGRPVRWDPAQQRIVGDSEAGRMLGRPMRPPWRI